MEYRYIIISDKQNSILYAECIEWKTTKYDKFLLKPISIALPQGFKAYIGASSQRADGQNTEKNLVEITLANKKHVLKFDNSLSGFIDLSSDRVLFNPLIDYCSNVEMWANKGQNSSIIVWRKNHLDLISELKKRFNIDFERNPELAFSFTFYCPIRVLVDFEFLDKPAKNEKRTPKVAKTTVLDEFQQFQDQVLKIVVWNKDAVSQTYELPIKNKNFQFNLDSFPDQMEFLIDKSGQLIYRKKHGFIRSIHVSGNAIVGSVLLPNGGRQNIIEKMDFVVGDNDEQP